jgi:hypothetical protein
MEETNFQYIWTQWIVPLVQDLYSQLDDEFRKYCNVQIRDLDKVCLGAEKYYQKKREEVKKAFYGKYRKGDSADTHRMDFHKIGAIICRTLIEYKVFDFDVNRCKEYVDQHISSYDTDWVVKNALINFRLAFYSSIVFLYQSMRFVYSKSNNELYNALCKRGKLDLYGIYNSKEGEVKESFENCIVLDLAKRDIGNHSFDYFMYAIILYQLEEHNKNLLIKEK